MGVAAPAFLANDAGVGSGGDGEQRRPRLVPIAGGRPSEGPAGATRVLLVEDDPSMRLVCRVNLEAAGFEVIVAETGSEALAACERERPDLVLLDVMLPDLGGFEVAERLGDVPVVFISARAGLEDLERGRLLGAIDYVTKPFDPIELPNRLSEDLELLREGASAGQVWQLRFGSPFDEH